MDSIVLYTPQYAATLVGLYVDEASDRVKKLGGSTRVLKVDGISFHHKQDARRDRINFEVEQGRITVATVG